LEEKSHETKLELSRDIKKREEYEEYNNQEVDYKLQDLR
jgi:hypothetical protein